MSDRQPQLTLVDYGSNLPEPLRELGRPGLELFHRIVTEYEVDAAGMEVLQLACESLDTAEALAAKVKAEGHIVRGRGGLARTHPALRDVMANRALCARLLNRLTASDSSTKLMGRPSGRLAGWAPDED